MLLIPQKLSNILLILLIFSIYSCSKSKVDIEKENLIVSEYNLDLTISTYCNKYNGWQFDYEYLNIYILKSKKDGEPTIIFNNNEVSLNELSNVLLSIQSERSDERKPKFVNLFIGEDIEMAFIKPIKEILVSNGLFHVNYVLRVPSFFKGIYRFGMLSQYLPPTDILLDESYNGLFKFSNIIELEPFKDTIYYLNDSLIFKSELPISIKNIIASDSNYAVIINYTGKHKVSEYLIMIAAARESVYSLRDELSLIQYSQRYAELDDEKAITIRRKFPCIEIENDGISPLITEIITEE